MTDKQIKEVFKNGFYCIEPWSEIKELQAELKRKEQECERLKEAYTDCAESRLIFVNKTEEFLHQLDQLKAENEALKSFDINLVGIKECEIRQLVQYRKALTEIKEIVGVGLVDGLQPEEYSGFLKILQGQILQKISECEVGDADKT